MAVELTTLDKLADVLEDMLLEYTQIEYEIRQRAIDLGAAEMVRALEADSPQGATHEYSKSWKVKDKKYTNHRYVGNTKTAKGVVHRKGKDGKQGDAREGVPLSNVLEYAENSPHQGRIRHCFESNKDRIFQAMKNYIKNQNGGK